MHAASAARGFDDDQRALNEVYGREGIEGGVNPGDRRAIYNLVAHLRPSSVLEIGTHVGASTAHFAMSMKRFSPPGANLTTVDIVDVNGPAAAWSQSSMKLSPRDSLREIGASDIVTFQTGLGLDALDGPKTYDLIFLDGDHSPTAVYREISAALKVLRRGGVILLHDFYPNCKPLGESRTIIRGPATAAARIAGEEASIEFVPLGELPWGTKDGGNFTSLALVCAR